MKVRSVVMALPLAGLILGLMVAPPSSASAPAAPTSKTTCRIGDSMSALGLNWTCQSVKGVNKMVTVSAAVGGSGPAGDVGKCRIGDWLTLGKLRLQCERAGNASRWTGARPGKVIAQASSIIQARPVKITGACAPSSSLGLVGIAVRCDKRRGTSAWTTQAKVVTSGPASTAPVALPAGANKNTCLNAWWDKEFAGVIPQLTRRQDQTLTERIWLACHKSYSKVMTASERDAAYADFFGRVGQLVADEVQRVSAATGQNPCQAVSTVLRPQYQPGYGLIGWDPSGFLPVLYKQWQGGPMIAKLGGNPDYCASGKAYLQLRRHYEGRHEGGYFPALGTPDANWILSQDEMQASWVKGATCLVWSPTFGNTAPGSPARVIGYNYKNMGFDGNMVLADFEVNKCEFKMAEAAGLPVAWKASANVNDGRTVSSDFAGVWHTMENNCSWNLDQVDTGARVSWTPTDGPYTSIQLKTGDRFASTCDLLKGEWEHMTMAPDGFMPLLALAPGPRRPSTPATCRYLVTEWSALRNPPAAGALAPYAGAPVSFETIVFNGTSKILRSVGCGRWELV